MRRLLTELADVGHIVAYFGITLGVSNRQKADELSRNNNAKSSVDLKASLTGTLSFLMQRILSSYLRLLFSTSNDDTRQAIRSINNNVIASTSVAFFCVLLLTHSD